MNGAYWVPLGPLGSPWVPLGPLGSPWVPFFWVMKNNSTPSLCCQQILETFLIASQRREVLPERPPFKAPQMWDVWRSNERLEASTKALKQYKQEVGIRPLLSLLVNWNSRILNWRYCTIQDHIRPYFVGIFHYIGFI